MDSRQTVLQTLDGLDIPYTLLLHEAVHTIDDCLHIEGINWTDTTIPRNAFLSNRQQTAFYLMLLRPDVPFRTAVVSKALGVSRLSFAGEAHLRPLLGLSAGAVSPLGLLFDTQRQVTLVMDEGLRDIPHLAFHPCDNTATVIMRQRDFVDVFLPSLRCIPRWVCATAAGEGAL